MPLSPPLSLYVHIPWCVRKCPYCDFNSHEKKADFNETAYVEALLLDLEQARKIARQDKLKSIFFGGGTPSLFSADSIQKIIHRAATLFNINDSEITLEANPGTFEQEKFSAYRNAGVNRLSIGIQSFNTNFLLALGRIHDGQQANNAIDTAKQAGFENINLDLMFGLPQQSTTQALDDIKIAGEHKVNHISHYQLTIEPNTWFFTHPPELPDTDTLWDIQTQCQQQLHSAGYKQYEVSAYTRADKQSQHNLNYWLFGDYIGIGAGAHSKLTNTGSSCITRQWNQRQPDAYIKAIHSAKSVSGKKVIAGEDLIFEFLLNALRLKRGCKSSIFTRHTGLNIKQLKHSCRDIGAELLTINDETICTTDRGFLFLNEILEQLL